MSNLPNFVSKIIFFSLPLRLRRHKALPTTIRWPHRPLQCPPPPPATVRPTMGIAVPTMEFGREFIFRINTIKTQRYLKFLWEKSLNIPPLQVDLDAGGALHRLVRLMRSERAKALLPQRRLRMPVCGEAYDSGELQHYSMQVSSPLLLQRLQGDGHQGKNHLRPTATGAAAASAHDHHLLSIWRWDFENENWREI